MDFKNRIEKLKKNKYSNFLKIKVQYCTFFPVKSEKIMFFIKLCKLQLSQMILILLLDYFYFFFIRFGTNFYVE